MKKILTTLAIIALAASCSPLRIIMNTKGDDGSRTILTSDLRLFNYELNGMDIALGAKINQKDTIFAVLLTSDKDSNHGIFSKNDRMMVRLSDQSVITLTNVYDREFETSTDVVHTTDRVSSFGYEYYVGPYTGDIFVAPYEINAFVPRTYTRKTSHSYALYLITRPQLDDIMGKEVIKLRVEVEDNELDMPNPGSASAIFQDLYGCLKEFAKAGFKHSEF